MNELAERCDALKLEFDAKLHKYKSLVRTEVRQRSYQ